MQSSLPSLYSNSPTITYDNIGRIRHHVDSDDGLEEIEIDDSLYSPPNSPGDLTGAYPTSATIASNARPPSERGQQPRWTPQQSNTDPRWMSKQWSTSSIRGDDRRDKKEKKKHKKHSEQSRAPRSRDPMTDEYWVLPRPMYKPPSTSRGNYPAGNLFPRNRNSSKGASRSSQHLAMQDDDSQATEALDGIGEETLQRYDVPDRKLKLYFRYQGQDEVDYASNSVYLTEMQSHCRGWLARKRADRLWDERRAICVIQRNARIILEPWCRLFLNLRPFLKVNSSAEEILRLKSELEHYIWLLRMLRFENNDQQTRIKELLQLMNQLDANDANKEVINVLVNQSLDRISQSQGTWSDLSKNNPILRLPDANSITPIESAQQGALPDPASSKNADFYQNQFDILKEEADEQQMRTTEYFKNQINTLTDRVVQLQNQLAAESGTSGHLNTVVDELKSTMNDGESYQRQLESTVELLTKQLNRSRPAMNSPTLGRAGDSANNQSAASLNDLTSVTDMGRQLDSYEELFRKLRQHVAQNPKSLELLSDTPFDVGREFDLISPRSRLLDRAATLPTDLDLSQLRLMSQSRGDDMLYDSHSEATTAVVAELRRQISVVNDELNAKQQSLNTEIEDRERVESENTDLHHRLNQLRHELRRTKDEHEEAVTGRDHTYERRMKDLGEHLDDELKANEELRIANKRLNDQLIELRRAMNESEDEQDEQTDGGNKANLLLRNELLQYKHALEAVQDEYDQFSVQNSPEKFKRMEAEKEENILNLQGENKLLRMDNDALNVKLQHTNRLLDEVENRVKSLTREKQANVNRIQLLETERDASTREAALASGRATTEREGLLVKTRELDAVRLERDSLRRELMEVKKELAGTSAELGADKRQLETRLQELLKHSDERVADLKNEIERSRYEVECLQSELQSTTTTDIKSQASLQSQRWRITELEDQLTHSKQRISQQERDKDELQAELTRFKADFSASRELVSAMRRVQEHPPSKLLLEQSDDDPPQRNGRETNM